MSQPPSPKTKSKSRLQKAQTAESTARQKRFRSLLLRMVESAITGLKSDLSPELKGESLQAFDQEVERIRAQLRD